MSTHVLGVAAAACAVAAVAALLRLRREGARRHSSSDGSDGSDPPASVSDALFARAARAAVATARGLTQAQRADLYRHYKQATEGPCATPPPSIVDWVARAKHDAWRSLGAMPRADAAARYVALVDALAPAGWRDAELPPPRSTDDDEDVDNAEADTGDGGADGGSGFVAVSRPVADAPLTAEELRGDIFAASLAGDAAAVAALLDAGAPVDSRNEARETPLHAAADGGHADIVRLLLARGADAHAVEEGGQTPLDYAVALGHGDAVAALRAAGA